MRAQTRTAAVPTLKAWARTWRVQRPGRRAAAPEPHAPPQSASSARPGASPLAPSPARASTHPLAARESVQQVKSVCRTTTYASASAADDARCTHTSCEARLLEATRVPGFLVQEGAASNRRPLVSVSCAARHASTRARRQRGAHRPPPPPLPMPSASYFSRRDALDRGGLPPPSCQKGARRRRASGCASLRHTPVCAASRPRLAPSSSCVVAPQTRAAAAGGDSPPFFFTWPSFFSGSLRFLLLAKARTPPPQKTHTPPVRGGTLSLLRAAPGSVPLDHAARSSFRREAPCARVRRSHARGCQAPTHMYANVSAPLLVRHRNAPRPTCSAARAGPAVRARTPQRRRRSDGVEQCALAAPPPAAAAAAALPLRVRAASTVCAFATLSALTLGLPVRALDMVSAA
jgi:hypothetical protein